MIRTSVFALIAAAFLMIGLPQAQAQYGMKKGDAELKSVGPMTFGPNGILFIGDPKAATIYAVLTGDNAGDASKVSVNVDGVNGKIAAMLGTTADQIQINDVAANPRSGNVYLSVSRGQGSETAPIILRVDGAGKISEFPLKGVTHSKATLPNAPEDKVTGQGRRRQNDRLFSITDLSFVDGRVVVAGLSNEEFASNLRAISFPFSEVDSGTSIEIFHGAHGKLETRSPVRTFIPVSIDGEPQIIAAYTCTPLVRIPLSDLKRAGEKIRGTTVAELGNRNRPLDMIAYTKGGKDYLLMANNNRGVMKITTSDITKREGINERIRGIAGQPYETIESLENVTQLDKLNDTHAVLLIENEGKSTLKTIELP